jgi:hypothetical protein
MEHKTNLYTLNALLTMRLPKPESLINGLLFSDETVLFIARQKEGKSMLMLQLCLDVAAGKPFLGRYQCSKQKVFYIDYENRPYRLQQRVLGLLNGEQPPDDLCFYALNNLSDRDLSLGLDDNFDRLYSQVQELKPGLLVIDPLRYASDGELDEKHSLEIVERVAQLKRDNPAMAVVLVHHLRKSGDSTSARLKLDPRSWVDKVYGSQALLAHVEAIWGMEKDDDGYTFATVPRSQAVLNLRLSKNAESEQFVFDGETRQELTPAEQEAWKKLPNSFTWTEGLKSVSNSTLGRTVRKTRENGMLFQDPETKQYRKLLDVLGDRENPTNMVM